MEPRFSTRDPNVGVPLAGLPPSSSRVLSWISRAVFKPGFPLEREVQIRGAVSILRGIEYHHRAFLHRFAQLDNLVARQVSGPAPEGALSPIPKTAEFEILADLHHEAVAYVNRLGQFHYFAKSVGLVGLVPTITRLLPFRHKHTAHRSTDKPRSESAAEQQSQAMAFGWGHNLEGGFLVFRLLADGKFHTLNLRDSHPFVVTEVVAVFEAIFPLPPDV